MSQRVVVVVMEAFDGRLLAHPVPSFDRTIRPRGLDLGPSVLNLMLASDPLEDVLEGKNVPIMIGEPNAIARSE